MIIIKNKQKLRKKTFAVFATVFVTLALFFIMKPTNTTVSASSSNASYDVTNFNPFIGATFAVRSSNGASYTTNIADLPYLRLNNSAISANNITVGYLDYTASSEGYEFYCNYTSGYASGVLYSFSANDIWLPSDFVSELDMLDLFDYTHEVQGGWSIRYQIEVEYLNNSLEVDTLVYLSDTFTSNSSSGTFKGFASAYPSPYKVSLEGNNYSYLKRLRISCLTNLNGGGTINGSFNYTTPELYTMYSAFVDNQTTCMTSLITALQQDISWYDSIVVSVESLLNLHILPNFRIMDILILALTIPLTIWLLKAWLGG